MSELLEQFDTIFDSSESVKELEKLILDMAVKGLLIPQNLNDEPAGVLLEKIKKEREWLIKEKVIKREKIKEEITEEEKSYSIPDSWSWARIGDLLNPINGKAFKPSEWSTEGLPIIRIQNLNNVDAPFNYCNFDVDEKFSVHDGDLLIGWSGTPGTSFGAFIWQRGEAVLNQHIFKAQIYGNHVDVSFFRYLINANLDVMISKAHGGVGLQHITKGKFINMVVAIPPRNEQKQIVRKIDQLMGFCQQLKERLEKKQRRENRLNVSAFSSLEQSATDEELQENLQFVLSHLYSLCTDIKHVQQLRNAILSLAVKGKLVLQEEIDEPASVLLERIKIEKEQLIKEKKRKKEKPLPQITDEEKPFELPNGWEWTYIDNIGFTVTGKTPPTNNPAYYEGNIPFLNPANITNGIVSYEGKKISEEGAKYSQIIPNNSILIVCINGSLEKGIGRAGKITRSVAFNQQINAIVPNESLNSDYLLLAIRSPFFQKKIKEKATGTVNYIINKNSVRSLSLPLPPLNEQNRIVEKVSKFMSLCDELEKKIEDSKQENEKLMKAVLQEAFAVKEEVLS